MPRLAHALGLCSSCTARTKQCCFTSGSLDTTPSPFQASEWDGSASMACLKACSAGLAGGRCTQKKTFQTDASCESSRSITLHKCPNTRLNVLFLLLQNRGGVALLSPPSLIKSVKGENIDVRCQEKTLNANSWSSAAPRSVLPYFRLAYRIISF